MRHYALSAIGRDRPGIVAGITRVLVDHEVNVEDSQATILRGHFTIVLIIALPDGGDVSRLDADLRAEASRLGLEAIALQEVADVDADEPEPSHTVTVYGVDHPGIVHATAEALAAQGANITDVNTRLVSEEGTEPLYALMMEVAVPTGNRIDALRAALEAAAEREGLEVALNEIQQDAL